MEKCKSECMIHMPAGMTHNDYDFYRDISKPIKLFMRKYSIEPKYND